MELSWPSSEGIFEKQLNNLPTSAFDVKHYQTSHQFIERRNNSKHSLSSSLSRRNRLSCKKGLQKIYNEIWSELKEIMEEERTLGMDSMESQSHSNGEFAEFVVKTSTQQKVHCQQLCQQENVYGQQQKLHCHLFFQQRNMEKLCQDCEQTEQQVCAEQLDSDVQQNVQKLCVRRSGQCLYNGQQNMKQFGRKNCKKDIGKQCVQYLGDVQHLNNGRQNMQHLGKGQQNLEESCNEQQQNMHTLKQFEQQNCRKDTGEQSMQHLGDVQQNMQHFGSLQHNIKGKQQNMHKLNHNEQKYCRSDTETLYDRLKQRSATKLDISPSSISSKGLFTVPNKRFPNRQIPQTSKGCGCVMEGRMKKRYEENEEEGEEKQDKKMKKLMVENEDGEEEEEKKKEMKATKEKKKMENDEEEDEKKEVEGEEEEEEKKTTKKRKMMVENENREEEEEEEVEKKMTTTKEKKMDDDEEGEEGEEKKMMKKKRRSKEKEKKEEKINEEQEKTNDKGRFVDSMWSDASLFVHVEKVCEDKRNEKRIFVKKKANKRRKRKKKQRKKTTKQVEKSELQVNSRYGEVLKGSGCSDMLQKVEHLEDRCRKVNYVENKSSKKYFGEKDSKYDLVEDDNNVNDQQNVSNRLQNIDQNCLEVVCEVHCAENNNSMEYFDEEDSRYYLLDDNNVNHQQNISNCLQYIEQNCLEVNERGEVDNSSLHCVNSEENVRIKRFHSSNMELSSNKLYQNQEGQNLDKNSLENDNFHTENQYCCLEGENLVCGKSCWSLSGEDHFSYNAESLVGNCDSSLGVEVSSRKNVEENRSLSSGELFSNHGQNLDKNSFEIDNCRTEDHNLAVNGGSGQGVKVSSGKDFEENKSLSSGEHFSNNGQEILFEDSNHFESPVGVGLEMGDYEKFSMESGRTGENSVKSGGNVAGNDENSVVKSVESAENQRIFCDKVVSDNFGGGKVIGNDQNYSVSLEKSVDSAENWRIFGNKVVNGNFSGEVVEGKGDDLAENQQNDPVCNSSSLDKSVESAENQKHFGDNSSLIIFEKIHDTAKNKRNSGVEVFDNLKNDDSARNQTSSGNLFLKNYSVVTNQTKAINSQKSTLTNESSGVLFLQTPKLNRYRQVAKSGVNLFAVPHSELKRTRSAAIVGSSWQVVGTSGVQHGKCIKCSNFVENCGKVKGEIGNCRNLEGQVRKKNSNFGRNCRKYESVNVETYLNECCKCLQTVKKRSGMNKICRNCCKNIGFGEKGSRINLRGGNKNCKTIWSGVENCKNIWGIEKNCRNLQNVEKSAKNLQEVEKSVKNLQGVEKSCKNFQKVEKSIKIVEKPSKNLQSHIRIFESIDEQCQKLDKKHKKFVFDENNYGNFDKAGEKSGKKQCATVEFSCKKYISCDKNVNELKLMDISVNNQKSLRNLRSRSLNTAKQTSGIQQINKRLRVCIEAPRILGKSFLEIENEMKIFYGLLKFSNVEKNQVSSKDTVYNEESVPSSVVSEKNEEEDVSVDRNYNCLKDKTVKDYAKNKGLFSSALNSNPLKKKVKHPLSFTKRHFRKSLDTNRPNFTNESSLGDKTVEIEKNYTKLSGIIADIKPSLQGGDMSDALVWFCAACKKFYKHGQVKCKFPLSTIIAQCPKQCKQANGSKHLKGQLMFEFVIEDSESGRQSSYLLANDEAETFFECSAYHYWTTDIARRKVRKCIERLLRSHERRLVSEFYVTGNNNNQKTLFLVNVTRKTEQRMRIT